MTNDADKLHFVPPDEVEASVDALEKQRAVIARIESNRFVNAIAQPRWRGEGPEPRLVSYHEALRGTDGIDFFSGQACRKCGCMPYFNGRRIVDPPHDAGKHGMAKEEHVPASTSLAIDRAAANLRARRSQGELLDD